MCRLTKCNLATRSKQDEAFRHKWNRSISEDCPLNTVQPDRAEAFRLHHEFPVLPVELKKESTTVKLKKLYFINFQANSPITFRLITVLTVLAFLKSTRHR